MEERVLQRKLEIMPRQKYGGNAMGTFSKTSTYDTFQKYPGGLEVALREESVYLPWSTAWEIEHLLVLVRLKSRIIRRQYPFCFKVAKFVCHIARCTFLGAWTHHLYAIPIRIAQVGRSRDFRCVQLHARLLELFNGSVVVELLDRDTVVIHSGFLTGRRPQ